MSPGQISGFQMEFDPDARFPVRNHYCINMIVEAWTLGPQMAQESTERLLWWPQFAVKDVLSLSTCSPITMWISGPAIGPRSIPSQSYFCYAIMFPGWILGFHIKFGPEARFPVRNQYYVNMTVDAWGLGQRPAPESTLRVP